MERVIPVILGPTASGKSSIGVELAMHLGGEIISADSRQIYRGMDVGTGKITIEEMQGIPHHLLSIRDPWESYSVADFRQDAIVAIKSIFQRKKLPIIVGGTGLYISSLVQGYTFSAVERDPTVQEALEKELQEGGEDALFAELQQRDPEKAALIDPKNHRYLIRALEIARHGKFDVAQQGDALPYTFRVFALNWPREELVERINERHRAMFVDDAIVKETQKLLAAGATFDMESMSSIGYREVGKYLRGEFTKEEAVEKTCAAARQYSKRQMTWLRRMERFQPITWVPMPNTGTPIIAALSH